MHLSPPAQVTFIISLLLAILAVRYAHAAIPVVSGHSFETLLAAFFGALYFGIFTPKTQPQ